MTRSAVLVGVIENAGRSSDSVRRTVLRNCRWLEVRADLLPEIEPDEIRQWYPGLPLQYTWRRSVAQENGASLDERHARLRGAAERYDYLTLEGECDLVPDVLKAIAPERRIVSWHGNSDSPEALEALLERYGRTPARLYRFALEHSEAADRLEALQFLQRIRRRDVIAYESGASGVWTRLLAARLGAPMIFGSVPASAEPGASEPTIPGLIADYGLPELAPVREVYAIVGGAVAGSLSPRLHNAAYRAGGFARLYLSFPAEDFQRFWERLIQSGAMEALGYPIAGLTIASPHKECALEAAEDADPLCRQCGATNLLVRREGAWFASTSDPEGVLQESVLASARQGARVAVVGCGGSGRTVAAALHRAGLQVTLVNRSPEHGKRAAKLLGLPFVPLAQFSAAGYGVLVNATPVGRLGEPLAIDLKTLETGATVVDLVYRPDDETPLTKWARARGHPVLDGRQVLLAQIRRQYHLMTGETMPLSFGGRLLKLPDHANGHQAPLANHEPLMDMPRPEKIPSPAPPRSRLVERIRELAQTVFAARAGAYDEAAKFPAEDFQDLYAASLHAPCVPSAYGGLGLGPGCESYTLWQMTIELARADMSLARCWEGHVNSQVLIAALASEEQKRRWFEGIVAKGEIWVAWSGEPQTSVPGQKSTFGTSLEKVPGGYMLRGTKAYATSAGHARRAILLVNAAGPGGARHATAPADQLFLLSCDLAQPGVSYDGSWWNPIGMRATVSYVVRFDEVFVPDEDVIGRPGQYLQEGWQTRFSPHYAATFLGGAEAAYEYALRSIHQQKREDDPYVAHRIAEMALNLETAHLWLKHVAELWDQHRLDEAKAAAPKVRYLVEKLATGTLDHCVRACGARALLKPSPVERIYRDLSIYVRHDNADHVLATVGRQLLGAQHDHSFFNHGGSNGAHPAASPAARESGSLLPAHRDQQK